MKILQKRNMLIDEKQSKIFDFIVIIKIEIKCQGIAQKERSHHKDRLISER